MSGSTVLGGSGGAILARHITQGSYYLVARVKQWRAVLSVLEAAWGDSDSGGKTSRVGGREDMTGTISGVPDRDNPQHNNFLLDDADDPNNKNIAALILWEDSDEGIPEDYWYLPRALISQIEWGVDNDTKLPMDWTANFGADGLFYRPRQTTDGYLDSNTAASALSGAGGAGLVPL